MDFILVYARLRDVDFEDWVIVHWYPKTGMWRLSPYIEGADPIVSESKGWFPLPEVPKSVSAAA